MANAVRDSPEALSPLANIAQRLAVLLSAGVAPTSAWRYLAEAAIGPIEPILSEVVRQSAQGDIAEGILSAPAVSARLSASSRRTFGSRSGSGRTSRRDDGQAVT
ncbi:MAG: hypothetical protein ABIW81_06650 [Terrimesophilobacter sp.]